jgi:stearoyl-CoA desaturase (Delta-9 desaturase)
MIEFIYTLVMVQITIACVTLYLHRSQTHRAVQFHPAVNPMTNIVGTVTVPMPILLCCMYKRLKTQVV